RRLLAHLDEKAQKLISAQEREIAADLLRKKLAEYGAVKELQGSSSVDYSKAVIDMSKPPKKHTRFGAFSGMEIDAVATQNDPINGAVKLNFKTTSSLWYAIVPMTQYKKSGFVNDLIDPNMIEPITTGMGGKIAGDSKETSMPIENFDSRLRKPNEKEYNYVLYRNKAGAWWDAPFILNSLAVVDLVADLASGLRLVDSVNEYLKKTQKKLRENKFVSWVANYTGKAAKRLKTFAKNKWVKGVYYVLKGAYGYADAIAAWAGVDVTTVDQRYGQIRLFLKKFEGLISADPLKEYELREELDKKFSPRQRLQAMLANAVAQITHQIPKGENVKSVKDSKSPEYWEAWSLYALSYMGYKIVGERYKELMSYNGYTTAKKRDEAYRNAAMAFTLKRVLPSFDLKSLSAKERRSYALLNELQINQLLKGYDKKELLLAITKPEYLLKQSIKIKDYVMSMLNLSKSFNTQNVIGVISDIVYQSIKNMTDPKVIMAEVAKNIAMAVTPASWYRVLKGANQGAAMVWDLINKPTAFAFKIQRLSKKKMKFQEIVPPSFAPISYLDAKNMDGYDWKQRELWTVAPKDYHNKERLQVLLGADPAANLLVFGGFKYSMENDALLQEREQAQIYFERHEDDEVVFADWHVYNHLDYQDLKVPKRTKSTAYKGNYFFFAAEGEEFDCLHFGCGRDDEVYKMGKGNLVLDDYLRKQKKEKISYIGFTQLFENAGHKGVVTHSSHGVFTDSTYLWIGNREFKKAPVQYKASVRIYVAHDYAEEGHLPRIKSSLKLSSSYAPIIKGSCGEDDYQVSQKLKDIVMELAIPRFQGVHYYHFYLRDSKSGRYFGPLQIPMREKVQKISLSLKEMPGLIDFLNARGVEEGKELRGLKAILVDDIVLSFFQNNGIDEKLYTLMEQFKGKTDHNPFITFWLTPKATVIKDSDGDGLLDAWEEEHKLDPEECADGARDDDDDNLSNLQEYLHGTDLYYSDSDRDGMSDGWEVAYRLDPLDPEDGASDPDEDGYTNLEEYMAGTDPRKRSSHPTDDNPPVITILGDDPMTVALGEEYVDPGARAVDDIDGNLSVIVVENTVDTSVPGEYVVVYYAEDNAGNEANATRRVIVTGEPSSRLKKTGQTKSYDQEGNEVERCAVRDDGCYQAGVDPRYSRDDATGIVTDHITGLMWQDDYSDNGGSVKRANWEDAKSYCEGLTLGGHNDWYLPTINELSSIVDYGHSYPAMNLVFHFSMSNYFWSNTTYKKLSNAAWYIGFGYGYHEYYDKSFNLSIRCVREK
ncbi:MAG: DUF1566 domain-containing protein, partial [Epsilonproteobacteria bacterium]|nr:DUF1566 domain-containing protein [Campylobacterota bacterium]